MPESPAQDAATHGVRLRLVAVGASAGGLKAFREFLTALPFREDVAVILVLHLDPTRESTVREMLAPSTHYQVVQAAEGMRVEGGKVYVIAPNTTLTVKDGTFHTVSPRVGGSVRQCVDFLFTSLAAELGPRSIGVVLSGSGSDGAAGLQAIQQAGGLTFAQDVSADNHGMPDAAKGATAVDHRLPPARIAAEVARLLDQPAPPQADPHAFTSILEVIANETGIDFPRYKPATLERRIRRRMDLLRLPDMDQYLEALQQRPEERRSLRDDLLINVTAFFRDPPAYAALAKHAFPHLPADGSRTIRVWAAGCATGEEAYSIAIALIEHFQASGTPDMQIFGTDVDDDAIAHARRGVYAASIAKEVGAERLARFFIQRPDGNYEICREVRDKCLFARHDLLRDPPYSGMDLVSCRNVLIYLGKEAQQQVLPAFHYALRKNGFLFLGPAEPVPDGSLFDEADKKHRIFRRSPGVSPHPTGRPAPPFRVGRIHEPPAASKSRDATLEEAVNRLLLEQHAPPGIVVDDGGHILHVCGDMSAYIRPSPGKPALQVERMLREEFHADFEAALAETRNSGLPARREMTRLGNEGVRRVSLHMQPLPSCSPAYLAVFTASAEATSESAIEASPADAARLKAEVTTLRHLIATQKGHHAEVVRRLEATIEELRSTQEEFVAANEEFQSANEELETAKEEVQSANEELITVNDQLRSHSEELSSLYADLQNVLASIQVPVVLVDANLRIRRATEGTQRLLNALPSDLGRPITDLRTNLDDNLVIQTIAQCIKTGRPAEEESQDRNGHWYSLRAHPYMTGPRQHNGAVLVIVDIDAEKQAGLRHHKALVLAESVIDTIRDPLVLLDGQLRVTRANGAFHRAFATEASAIVGKQLAETVAGDILESVRLVIEGGPSLVDFEATWNLESGPRNMLVNARRIPPYEDRPDLVVLTATDVTERRRAHAQLEAARRQQLEHLEKLNAFKAEFIASAAHELGNPLTPLKMQLEILGSKADLDPAVEKGIKVIRRSAERLATLVEDMVAVGRFQAGRLELRKAPLDLAQLAEQAIETYKDAAQAAGIKLEAPNLLPTWVHADASHLAQVVNNLVSNAIKYTPQGGLVALGIDAGGGIARLSVADNGIGLSREAKGKLFEPFTRVHDPSLRIPGTGLGLYICKGIVELHGGRLYAESPGEGKGSTFTVELPETPDAALGKATK